MVDVIEFDDEVPNFVSKPSNENDTKKVVETLEENMEADRLKRLSEYGETSSSYIEWKRLEKGTQWQECYSISCLLQTYIRPYSKTIKP